MGYVSVSKGVLIGVVGVAAAALLALAYQLGRASGSESVPAPPTRIERVAPRTQEAPTPWPTPVAVSSLGRQESSPAARPASSIPDPTPAGLAAPGATPAPIGGWRAGVGLDTERAAVAAYFDAIERIQAGSMSGEANSVANEMAAALASGDTSSLEKMIRDTESARARLAAVVPPAPCVTHHRESIGSLDDALEVLKSLKAAMDF